MHGTVQTLHKLRNTDIPDSKVHGANMGPTWVLSAPDGPHELCYQGIRVTLPMQIKVHIPNDKHQYAVSESGCRHRRAVIWFRVYFHALHIKGLSGMDTQRYTHTLLIAAPAAATLYV